MLFDKLLKTEKIRVTLDRLLWVPNYVADLAKIKRELTVQGEAFTGAGRIVEAFEEHPDCIGVPRAYGLSKFPHITVDDETVFPNIVWPDFSGSYREGQLDAIEDMYKTLTLSGLYGGLLEAKCAFGKTLVGLLVAAKLQTPALVIVHKSDLADQWKQTALGDIGKKIAPLLPGCRIGHVQQDVWDYKNKHFTVAMVQTLAARSAEIPEDFLKSFGMVIIDEGHHIPSDTAEKVLRMLPARYRLGVSATWRRGDGLECLWNWHIGAKGHTGKGRIVVGDYYQVDWKTNLNDMQYKRGGKIMYAALITAISQNIAYNVWLCEQAIKGAQAGRKILVLSDRVGQCVDLRNRILAAGTAFKVGLYVGSIDGKRMTKSQLDESKECDIILGTYGMFAEGTDVPALDTLILATPRTDIEQCVGRIQRPFSDKKRVLVVDPIFSTPVNRGMGNKRAKVLCKLGFTRKK